MMKSITWSIGILFFCFLSSLSAQKSSHSLVYQISALEYLELLTAETPSLSFLEERNPHTKTSGYSLPNDSPPGHYIVLRANGERISWELQSMNLHQVYIHDDQKQLNIGIMDTLGRGVSAADVRFEKRRVRYDPTAELYSSRRIKPGLLTIYLPNDTIFYGIETEYNRSVVLRRLKYFSGSRVGRIISWPVRVVRGPISYFRRGFGRGNWRIYNWPFERLYRRIRNGGPRPKFNGFLASQQPIYRHGDTLKLSATLTDEKGRPIKGPLDLRISSPRRQWIETEVSPEAPGRFTYEWPLVDSLPLDTRYTVWLRKTHRGRTRSIRYSFQIEDYELEEFSFSLENRPPTFAADEPVLFDLKAEDTNQLPIPTATVDAYVISQKFAQLHQDSVSVPDTIWQYRQEFGNRTILTLEPPDSIWPAANLMAEMRLYFRGPSGELITDQHEFTVERHPARPKLNLANGHILTSFTSQLSEGAQAVGTLTAFNGSVPLYQMTVGPDEAIRLNPNATRYKWTVQDQHADLLLMQGQANVQFNYHWKNDSLVLQWSNPHELPIHWSVKSTRSIVEEGIDSLANYQVSLPISQSRRQLWLHYSYLWTGFARGADTDMKALRTQLQVQLEAPTRIYPGQKSELQVAIQDDRGRPVKGAAVTIGAYNAQMRKGTPFELTDLSFRGRRKAFHRQSYLEGDPGRFGSVGLNSHWIKAFELDSQLYYQMRVPRQEAFLHYRDLSSEDSLARATAQIAPYVTDDYDAQPIHLIYLDNRLMYFSEAWQTTPYSIVAEAGYHQLTLRTPKAEIRMDSVLLKAGKQLVLSLDISRINSSNVKIFNREPEMTKSEIRQIESRLFHLGPRAADSRSQYLYQDPRMIFRMPSGKRGQQTVGLFSAGRDIIRLRPGKDTLRFNFEPYFYYEPNKERDRLYSYRPYSEATTPPKYAINKIIPALEQEALFPSDIKGPIKTWRYFFDKPPQEAANGRGRLQVFSRYLPRGTKAMLLGEGDSIRYILPVDPTPIAIPAGDYELYLVTKQDEIWELPVRIQAQQLLALRIDSTMLHPSPISEDWKNRLLTARRYGVSQRSTGRRPTSRTQPSWIGRGQLINGYITDDQGEPLIGATILVRGTAVGTVTDIDGYYELWAPPGDIEIIVSYTGFSTERLQVNRSSTMDISLGEDSVSLDEVVVTGYAAVRSSSQSRIDQLTAVNLQGSLPGVTVSEDISNRNAVTEIGLPVEDLEAPLDSIRSDFRDNAYWQPLLTTDQNGNATFEVHFPDDITNWRHFALAMDRKSRIGLSAAQTKAYLPLQAQLYIPRFLVQGDQSEAIGLFNNRTGQAQNILTFFENWTGERQEKSVNVEDALRQTYPITLVPDQDSLSFRLGLRQGDYADGEERSLPVFRRGISRTIGGYKVLKNEQVMSLQIDEDKGPVDLLIGGNALPQMRKAIHQLKRYPHGCNEQTASRLIALLANEQLGEWEIEEVDLQEQIRAGIRRLEKNRHKDGRWGWWSSSNYSSHWITLHVIRAFDLARERGYRTPDVSELIREIIAELPGYAPDRRWSTLAFLAERGQQLDYNPYLSELDTLVRDLSTEMIFRRVQQLSGAAYTLDSLERYRQETLTGASYFGERTRWYQIPYRHSTRLSLKALQLYRDHGDEATSSSLEQYFLEPPFGRPLGYSYHLGVNTYEASLIVKNLLPALLSPEQQLDSLKVYLEEGEQTQVISDLEEPVRRVLSPREATQQRLRKTGSGPAFISYSQTYWEENPEPEENGFTIRTIALQHNKISSNWAVGEKANLETVCDVSKEARYVKIEIPVPAGCSYGEKVFRETVFETHREYRRDRVVIYCERLPAGKYTFNVPLETRFAGQYHVNPAEVEMMYIPTFNGVGNTMEIKIQ